MLVDVGVIRYPELKRKEKPEITVTESDKSTAFQIAHL
jgi:hypothetical protein